MVKYGLNVVNVPMILLYTHTRFLMVFGVHIAREHATLLKLKTTLLVNYAVNAVVHTVCHFLLLLIQELINGTQLKIRV